MKLEGDRIVVDVERGRTVKDWVPRRLGGGVQGRRSVPPPPVGRKRSRSPSYSVRSGSPKRGYRRDEREPMRYRR